MTAQACKAELAPIRPLAKFLCIKGVVFFTYWQGIGIAMAQSAGLIKARDKWTTYDTDDVAAGLQACPPQGRVHTCMPARTHACMHARPHARTHRGHFLEPSSAFTVMLIQA